MIRNYRKPLVIAGPKNLLRLAVWVHLSVFVLITDTTSGCFFVAFRDGTWNTLPICLG